MGLIPFLPFFPAPFSTGVSIGESSYLVYRVPTGSHGGSNVINFWTDYPINTVEVSAPWIQLAGNTFTIDGVLYPGKYLFDWSALFHGVRRSMTRLYRTNTASTIYNSLSEYSSDTAPTSSNSTGKFILDIRTTDSFKIQYLTEFLKTSSGLGVGAYTTTDLPDFCIFGYVRVTKLQTFTT